MRYARGAGRNRVQTNHSRPAKANNGSSAAATAAAAAATTATASAAAAAAWLDCDSTRRGVDSVTPVLSWREIQLCHAHDRVVTSAIMRCGLRIITCHENPVVLA